MLFNFPRKQLLNNQWHEVLEAKGSCGNVWQQGWQKPYNEIVAAFQAASEADTPETWAHLSSCGRRLRELMSQTDGEEARLYVKLVRLTDTVEAALDEAATPDNLIPRGQLNELINRIDQQTQLIEDERNQTAIWQVDYRRQLDEIEKRIGEGKGTILKIQEFNLLSFGIDELISTIKDSIIAIKNGIDLLNDGRFSDRLRNGARRLEQVTSRFYNSIKKRFEAFRLPWRHDSVDREIEEMAPWRGIKILVRDGPRDIELLRVPGAGVSFADRWEEQGQQFSGPELVVIPPGEFLMGSPVAEEGHSNAEAPQHHVVIPKPFALGVYPVTFADWDACFAAGGVDYEPDDQGWGRGERPVINVSWEDAQRYIEWLRRMTGKEYCLPNEAEWEYAARAGSTGPFWWGKSISTEQANYDGNYIFGSGPKGKFLQRSLPVKSFSPNPWGLYQIHGNVWEWCQDKWHDSYDGKPNQMKINGDAWISGGRNSCVLRGGCWLDAPERLRSAFRNWGTFGNRMSLTGFRIGRKLISF